MTDAPRYAIYFAPTPETALWRFGSAILGYDGATGEDVSQSVPEGIDAAAFRALTEEPRRYAFHATIKAPFRMAASCGEAELVAALEAFSAARQPFALPRLAVMPVGSHVHAGGFVALMEPSPTPALVALERAAVEAFEPFRAPPAAAEIARRQPGRLSERQRLYIERYGYPYVLEEFRFHMTLTGRVSAAGLEPMVAALAGLFAGAAPAGPVPVDALCLFRQQAGGRFRILARCPFNRRGGIVGDDAPTIV